ncbi:MAG TPA: hypothetical protein VF540_06135 [Segetibacter sp.]
MKSRSLIISLVFLLSFKPAGTFSQGVAGLISVDFYGDTIEMPLDSTFKVPNILHLSDSLVQSFYKRVNNSKYLPIINALVSYKEQHGLNDWLYYQLIRSTAEQVSPKAANYQRYTLYKWFLLAKSGYATTISIRNDRLLLYVQSDEDVFNIPCHNQNGKQYVCLNYHDYGNIDFDKEKFTGLNIYIPEAKGAFSYKVTRLPDFKAENYTVKELQFDYYQTEYHFKVMLNKQVKKIFNNYPVVNYETYFNIPLSNATYSSLIPLLRENIKKMNQKKGVDYLMRFTRYAFVYETDTESFGAEKRLSPEQALLYDYSDCDDRAGLFFYLVKELYNLPMIVLSYPQHISIAVKFDKPIGDPIVYKGNDYSVCEPTPQKEDLRIGESLPNLRKAPYDVVYSYNPIASIDSK